MIQIVNDNFLYILYDCVVTITSALSGAEVIVTTHTVWAHSYSTHIVMILLVEDHEANLNC